MDKKRIITNIREGVGEMYLANSFRPQANVTFTKTYQPQGSSEVPKVIPHLVSGVATPPAQPAPQPTTNNGSKE